MTKMQSPLNARLCTLEFLWSSANKVGSVIQRNRNLEIIQNQLREKCLNLAKGRSGGVNCSSAFQESAICRYCGTPWSEGSYRLRISPHTYKMKKLKDKLDSRQESLSKYNKYLIGLFNKRKDNVLEKQCQICKKTTKLGLTKPLPPRKEALSDSLRACESSFQEDCSEVRKKKKKRNKKDRFSGLVSSAVMSARTSQGFRNSLGDVEGSEISLTNSNISEPQSKNNYFLSNESKACLVTCLQKPIEEPQASEPVSSLEEKDYFQNDYSDSTNSFGDLNVSTILYKSSNNLSSSTNISAIKKRSKNRKKKKMKLSTSNSFISFSDNSFMSNKSIQESDTSQKNIIKLSPLMHIDSKPVKGTTNYLAMGNKRSASEQYIEHNENLKASHKKKKKKSSITDFLSFL